MSKYHIGGYMSGATHTKVNREAFDKHIRRLLDGFTEEVIDQVIATVDGGICNDAIIKSLAIAIAFKLDKSDPIAVFNTFYKLTNDRK